MKFMRNGLLVLTLLSLCSEMLPRGGGGHGGGHGGGRGGRGGHGGGRGGRGHGGYGRGGRGYGHGGYGRGGWGGRGWGGRGWGGYGVGIGLGTGLGIGLYSGWGYGGWNSWNNPYWYNTAPYWYQGSSWNSLSLSNKLDAINEQIAVVKEEVSQNPDNTDAQNQLNYLIRRRDQLARKL